MNKIVARHKRDDMCGFLASLVDYAMKKSSKTVLKRTPQKVEFHVLTDDEFHKVIEIVVEECERYMTDGSWGHWQGGLVDFGSDEDVDEVNFRPDNPAYFILKKIRRAQ